MSKRCLLYQPSLLDKMRAFIGLKVETHKFTYFKREGELVYLCRKCACGATQLLSAGGLGDGEWRDVTNKAWRWSWEQNDFESSQVLEEDK